VSDIRINGAEQPQVNAPAQAKIVVLESFQGRAMTKRYSLNDVGELNCAPYDNETHFKYSLRDVAGINDLAQLLEAVSASSTSVLIRGVPVSGLRPPARRALKNFQESPDGTWFVMIDYDDLALPDGMDPLGVEAIEYAVAQLPTEFHTASYFYQFSSSAGILRSDGTPLKSGLNVHVFFWLDRPVPGRQMAAYLQQHCIQTEFYERTFDKGGHPVIRYGVDLSVIRSAVQAHYVAHPRIEAGVRCALPARRRQGVVTKGSPAVTVPDLHEELPRRVHQLHRQLWNQHRCDAGFVKTAITTKASSGGVAVGSYYRHPSATVGIGRRFAGAEVNKLADQDVVRLFFEDENSPGSWYVSSRRPELARRYGDDAEMHLLELSPGAYEHVRDELKWFIDVSHLTLSLTEDGYLQDIVTFATARNSLVLAPTGSGKTTAFCRYAAANRSKTIIYAAQTIALTNQMVSDLRQAGVPVVHYRDWTRFDGLKAGVYVTTNESMKKFVEASRVEGRSFELVIDEAHTALDDFMKTNSKNELLERAVGRASKTTFMTATMTPFQMKKLMETVACACGDLTPENYACYEFTPVKSNPLWWGDSAHLGRDFVAMLRHYADLKSRGEAIPRTIIIAPTNAMRPFQLLLESFGLIEDAYVVSRKESTQAEIEFARTSAKPLLISSPLFALGLNFVHAPRRLWTYFTYLDVDTSQIIQTLNRANRGADLCEVRLYAGKLDDSPYQMPAEAVERARIEGYFLEESSQQGLLDSHFQVDRSTYLQLRQMSERSTAKALGRLKAGDNVQNYRIVEDWECPFKGDDRDAAMFKAAKKAARDLYDVDVEEQSERYAGETFSILFDRLEALRNEERQMYLDSNGRVPKVIEDEVRGIVSVLIDRLDDVALTKSVKSVRLLRLFGVRRPYLSAQFDPDRTGKWRDAAAEKSTEIVPLCGELKALHLGEIDGIAFAKKMRVKLRRSVLALADGESDFLRWQTRLSRMDELSEEYGKKASKKRRAEIDRTMFDIGREFLVTLGVTFGAREVDDGRAQVDPGLPIVPPWNFDDMARTLERNAASLKRMPSKPIDRELEALKWPSSNVSLDLCRNCVHCDDDFICAIGRPVQAWWDDIEPTTNTCDAYKKLSHKLLRPETA
jgi:hypothetical protein